MQRRSFLERSLAFFAGVLGLQRETDTVSAYDAQETMRDGREHGLRGDGVTDNGPTLATLASGHHVLPSGTYAVNTPATIPAGAVLELQKGAVMKLAPGIRLSGFEPVAGAWRILDIPRPEATSVGRRAIASVVHGWTTVDAMRPEWFGAQGDHSLKGKPGTDCSLAWQQCIETMEADDGSGPGIRFAGRHRFSEPVHILEGGFTIRGPGGHDTTNSFHGPPGLYPDANLRSVFDWGANGNDGNGRSSNAWLVFEGVASFGGSPEATGGRGQVFLEVTEARDGPRSGLTFRDCRIEWYERAMCEVSGAGQPAVANVLLEASRFSHVRHALLVTASRRTGRSDGTVVGFRMTGCYASQGARVTCAGNGAIAGPVEISNNILEGQDDPIRIQTGLASIRIGHNYWEDNGGTALVYVNATNRGTVIDFARQRIDNPNVPYPRYHLHVDGSGGARVTARDTDPGKVGISGEGLQSRSEIRGGVVGVLASEERGFASFHPWESVGVRRHPASLAAASYAWPAAPVHSPWGTMNTGFQSTFDSTYRSVDFAVAPGEWMVVTLPLHYDDMPGSGAFLSPYLEIRDSAYGVIASAQGGLAAVPGDGWTTVMFVLKASGASGGRVHLRFNPYTGAGAAAKSGAGCRIGPIGIYTLETGSVYIRPWIA